MKRRRNIKQEKSLGLKAQVLIKGLGSVVGLTITLGLSMEERKRIGLLGRMLLKAKRIL